MNKEKITYKDQDLTLAGYLAYEKTADKKPVVLVAPDWSGCNEFALGYAEKLAKLGYVGFALDMYGNGQVGTTNEEKTALMTPLKQNRQLLQHRILAAFNYAKTLPMVDPNKIGAIGFCFGGLCVLDLARSGADVTGVVSFHGLLDGSNLPEKKIKAKILALHGFDDPMGTSEQVLTFEKEMTAAKVDWQLHIFGNTMHAFMNPIANDPSFGTVYNQLAEHRSLIAMENFFEEIFA